MDTISGDYLNVGRTAKIETYPKWCSLDINEGDSRINLRFHRDQKVDFIFIDQLRFAVEQVVKFLRQ